MPHAPRGRNSTRRERLGTEGTILREEMAGSPTTMVCPGLRGFPSRGTVRAKIKKSHQDELVTFSREESPEAPQKDRGTSLNPGAGWCLLPVLGEAWLGKLLWTTL